MKRNRINLYVFVLLPPPFDVHLEKLCICANDFAEEEIGFRFMRHCSAFARKRQTVLGC